MEIDRVKALETAIWYHDLNRRGMKFDKPTAVNELKQFRLFSATEIGWIVGITREAMNKIVGTHDLAPVNHRVWKLDVLDVLWIMALTWQDKGVFSDVIVRLAVSDGTSMKAISQLTGIPLDKVREAVYGGQSMLGVLRSGIDPTSD